MTAIILPQLGEAITEATVIQWIKQVGDDVARDEPVVFQYSIRWTTVR